MARCTHLLTLATAMLAASAVAQEQDADERSKTQLALMEETIAGFEVSSDKIDKAALRFAAKPLLRYSDPTREALGNVLLDATVWRLGEKGRPTALVTLEIYRAGGTTALLSYEFASLTGAEFALRHKQNTMVNWRATGNAAAMKPLADAPPPATSATSRLTQMRQLARRFSVREEHDGTTVKCRLLAQPIDRYADADAKLVDGAIFAFANGTNPEIGVLLECDDSGWKYGLVRLSAAESFVELDDDQVAHFLTGDFRTTSGTYSASNHPLELK